MLVSSLNSLKFNPQIQQLQKNNKSHSFSSNSTADISFAKLPVGFKYGANINFGATRHVPDIDYEEYKSFKPYQKRKFRLKYASFYKDKNVNKDELFDQKYPSLPLLSERNMDAFIDVAKFYSKYKDQPIICLGRSPKWFLNAALWMKDGINDYKFCAFSKFWYRPDYREGVKRDEVLAPTKKEVIEYRKYLKNIQADPETIVNNWKATGKKTVITDYICSGKGACSFLEILGDFAKDKGILEDFSKSIELVGIGSREYMEDLNPFADDISDPEVPIPPVLRPYKKNIRQTFHNMDYSMFKEMLINQNSNECRSTYYPHDAWTVYKPDKVKVGLIKDMNRFKKTFREINPNEPFFTEAMQDYRNLLNFRILDGLNERGLLKTKHKSKV